jgi:hypothetical protein
MHQSYVDTEAVAFETKNGGTNPSLLIFVFYIFPGALWKSVPTLNNQKHLGLFRGNLVENFR